MTTLAGRLVVLVAALAGACGGAPVDLDGAIAADAAAIDATAIDAALDGGAPAPEPDLTHWIVGDPADRVASTTRGLIVMGGGTDVDEAFRWQRDRIGGGDVVVLRASGADGYDDYLFTTIGGVDSVETLLVDTRAHAMSPYVRWQIDHAEAIFLAGGDQAVYLAAWTGTPLADALAAAYQRGAVVGGTSAGAAVLGEIAYSATNGSVYSDEALADPYDAHVTFAPGLVPTPALAGIVTDTHFATRDRMGRLLAFVARLRTDGVVARPVGLGVNEATALVIDEHGTGRVVGAGAVYAIVPTAAPTTCAASAPLVWADVPLFRLHAGDTIALPAATATVAPASLSAAGGQLSPADPY
ncbi:MAG: cyanophycinase [Deltaproteobacteria bacterium]|nr:cyanophycinase [Deltaproteobacteria bacterium]